MVFSTEIVFHVVICFTKLWWVRFKYRVPFVFHHIVGYSIGLYTNWKIKQMAVEKSMFVENSVSDELSIFVRAQYPYWKAFHDSALPFLLQSPNLYKITQSRPPSLSSIRKHPPSHTLSSLLSNHLLPSLPPEHPATGTDKAYARHNTWSAKTRNTYVPPKNQAREVQAKAGKSESKSSTPRPQKAQKAQHSRAPFTQQARPWRASRLVYMGWWVWWVGWDWTRCGGYSLGWMDGWRRVWNSGWLGKGRVKGGGILAGVISSGVCGIGIGGRGVWDWSCGLWGGRK